MSETPRDPRGLWDEVSRTFEELAEALRVHLSPDAARSPSDPTGAAPEWADATRATDAGASGAGATGAGATGAGATGAGASGSPGRAGEDAGAADSDWVGPTSTADGTGPSDAAPESAAADPARPGEAEGSADPWAAATAADAPPPSASAPPPDAAARPDRVGTTAAGTGADGTAGTGADGPGAGSNGTGGTGAAGVGASGTGAAGAGTGTAGAGGAAGAGAGASGAAGAGPRGWREWSGSGGSSRFASGPDWESARESVREIGRSAQRIATQAGDAARDPNVRDSAQRAVRSLGDAIVTTVEELTSDLRERMRNPRWSDTSTPRPTERPPVAPIEDDRER
jgi:hypothetical protein